MNRPSRTDEPWESDGMNQSPNALSADLTTNQDLNGLVNARELRRTDTITSGSSDSPADEPHVEVVHPPPGGISKGEDRRGGRKVKGFVDGTLDADRQPGAGAGNGSRVEVAAAAGERTLSRGTDDDASSSSPGKSPWGKLRHALVTFGKFVGPGFMISVAYSKSFCPLMPP